MPYGAATTQSEQQVGLVPGVPPLSRHSSSDRLILQRVSLPVLRRALPEGLERTRPALRAELRERVDELGRDLGARRELTGWVLRTLPAFGEQVREGPAVPEACVTVEPVHHTTARPDFAIVDRQDPSRPRLDVGRPASGKTGGQID